MLGFEFGRCKECGIPEWMRPVGERMPKNVVARMAGICSSHDWMRVRVQNRAVTWSAIAMGLGAVLALALLHAWQQGAFVPNRGRMAKLPRLTLWAWDRAEFLEGFDGAALARAGVPKQAVAVAYLDQTILLTADGVGSRPRLQPVVFPEGAVRVAVARIEVGPGSDLSAGAVNEVVRLLLRSAGRPRIAALQVDFDAGKSQRAFYREVLTTLRKRMPRELPLSITALASWCAYDDWIHDLPVDEAVPMFFRMEPEWRNVSETDLNRDSDYQVREPLCARSIGLSVRERWPALTNGRRLYLFADYGWQPSTIQAALMRLE